MQIKNVKKSYLRNLIEHKLSNWKKSSVIFIYIRFYILSKFSPRFLFCSSLYSNEECFYDNPPYKPNGITLMNLYCGWKLNEGKYLICKIDFLFSRPLTSTPNFLLSNELLRHQKDHWALFIQLIRQMNHTKFN